MAAPKPICLICPCCGELVEVHVTLKLEEGNGPAVANVRVKPDDRSMKVAREHIQRHYQ